MTGIFGFMLLAACLALGLLMAVRATEAGTIDTSNVVLFDNWPGNKENRAIPQDDFTGTAARHNVVSPDHYPPGTRVTVYDDTNKGWSTLMYLQAGAASGTVAFAARQVCTVAGATDNPSTFRWYKVNNDGEDTLLAVGSPQCAIMISAMTADYYGWFWIGGVCPESYISDLAGTVSTFLEGAASTTNELFAVGDLTIDSLGLVPVPSVGGPAGVCLTVQTDTA